MGQPIKGMAKFMLKNVESCMRLLDCQQSGQTFKQLRKNIEVNHT